MDYYLGGYYLVKLDPLTFGSRVDQNVFTASECINTNLLGHWAYPWEKKPRKDSAEVEKTLGLSKADVDAIRLWVDEKCSANLIGWESVYFDKLTALNYQESFFSHLDDTRLLALYFNDSERKNILKEFKPESENEGEIGLDRMMLKRSIERPDDNERLLGFDLIGIEYGGSFHSFHCHDMADELCEKFGLVLNQFGLFDEATDWQPVLDHMNDEETGCEPVPWYVTKVKLVPQLPSFNLLSSEP